jgi:hypothetical protein
LEDWAASIKDFPVESFGAGSDMAGTSGVIGLLGGMSWESSALYYRGLNESVQRQLGAHHNARAVMLTLGHGIFHGIRRRGACRTLKYKLFLAI